MGGSARGSTCIMPIKRSSVYVRQMATRRKKKVQGSYPSSDVRLEFLAPNRAAAQHSRPPEGLSSKFLKIPTDNIITRAPGSESSRSDHQMHTSALTTRHRFDHACHCAAFCRCAGITPAVGGVSIRRAALPRFEYSAVHVGGKALEMVPCTCDCVFVRSLGL
jgi:hypothetical protein